MRIHTAILPVFALFLAAIGCKGGKVVNGITLCATPERACAAPAGFTYGVQYCTENDWDDEWTACCGYNDTAPNGIGGEWENDTQLDGRHCPCDAPWRGGTDSKCFTPLVLAFENEAVRYTSEMAGSFDLTGRGMSVATDWPTAATPWLALDRDGSGSIDDGGELFGSATRLPSGALAENGFAALAALDANGDGVIDARDPAFSRLVIWRDADASRSSDPSELTPASRELTSIELRYAVSPRCDERGNCEIERAAFHFAGAGGRDRTGTVIDVHLRHH